MLERGAQIAAAIAHAKAYKHPERSDQTTWQMVDAERATLVPYVGSFDGFHAVPASVSKTCFIRFDSNMGMAMQASTYGAVA